MAAAHRPLGLSSASPGLQERLTAHGFTPRAVSVADVIGALQPLDRMFRAEPPRDGGLQAFMARQTVINYVSLAQLEVEAALAALQCEGERGDLLRAQLDQIESTRSRNLSLAGLVISAGFAALSGGLSLAGAANASDIANIAGGAAGAAAAGALLYSDPTGRLNLNHTLLDELRHQPERALHFPPRVWRYLITPPAPGRPTPAEEIIEDWRSAGLLPQPGETSALFQADAVLSSDDLQQRDAMLDQVRARIALMSRSLRELMEEVLALPLPQQRLAAARASAAPISLIPERTSR
ncbi:MAG: hypothetical protein WCP77_02535 [Roseococcus sp.]